MAAMNRPAKTPVAKLTAEDRKARRQEAMVKAREAEKADKEKNDALMAALKESGKTVDELLDEANK